MEIENYNDKCIFRLLCYKEKDHGLKRNERKRLKRIRSAYPYSSDNFFREIDSDLKTKGYIKNNRPKGEFNADGDYQIAEPWKDYPYHISDRGLEALKNHTFKSESEEFRLSKNEKKRIKWFAIIGFVLSLILAFDKIVPLGPFLSNVWHHIHPSQ